jgi:pSer/pThr/pTyr-binding forkhead associated (FHA) protein
MPFLYQIDASGTALRRWELCPGQMLVIGRQPPADITLEDECLSCQHFALHWGANGFEVEDLGSKNGTWVNGERVSKALLKLNDTLRAGHTHFVLETGLATMLGELLLTAPTTAA